jgi:hypothetical protein
MLKSASAGMLSGDLDGEGLPGLDGIGQPPQLGDEVLPRIALLDVTLWALRHVVPAWHVRGVEQTGCRESCSGYSPTAKRHQIIALKSFFSFLREVEAVLPAAHDATLGLKVFMAPSIVVTSLPLVLQLRAEQQTVSSAPRWVAFAPPACWARRAGSSPTD